MSPAPGRIGSDRIDSGSANSSAGQAAGWQPGQVDWHPGVVEADGAGSMERERPGLIGYTTVLAYVVVNLRGARGR
jgi:hypothetical protein